MNKQYALTINIGDYLYPDPLWNESTRSQKLPVPVKVLDISIHAVSQTGTLFKVKTTRGEIIELDAGWFTGKATDVKTPEQLLSKYARK